MKTCSRCALEQPFAEFHKDRRRKDGFFPWCKTCRMKYDGRTPRQPRRYQTKAGYDVAYRERAKKAADYTDRSRRSYLWHHYRITPEQYAEMFESQGGRCAICRQPESSTSSKFGNKSGRLCVDHDHQCCDGITSCGSCVRGLLCGKCNAAIGALKDDPDLVQAAADYLRVGPGGRSPTEGTPHPRKTWDPLESTCRHASLSIL